MFTGGVEMNLGKGTTVTFPSRSVVLARCDTRQLKTRQCEFLSIVFAVASELSTSFAPSDCRERLTGGIACKSNILMFLDPHRRFCCYENGLCT